MSSSQSSLSEFSDENRLKFDQFNIMQIDFYQSFAIFRRIEACELIGFKIEENGCYVVFI